MQKSEMPLKKSSEPRIAQAGEPIQIATLEYACGRKVFRRRAYGLSALARLESVCGGNLTMPEVLPPLTRLSLSCRYAVVARRRGGHPRKADRAGSDRAGSQDPRHRRASAARSFALGTHFDEMQRGGGCPRGRYGRLDAGDRRVRTRQSEFFNI